MKKAIVLFLVLALSIPMLCFIATAEEYTSPYDARNVPGEITEIADENGFDTVVRFYEVPLEVDFLRYDSIEEVFADSEPYYAMIQSEMVRFYKIENGCAVALVKPFIHWNSATTQELITQEVLYTISQDIRIECVYYLHGEYDRLYRTAVYYKTDLGDYVYFFSHEGKELTMSADNFMEYTHAVIEYRVKQQAMYGRLLGSYQDISMDLSAYDWRSPDFDPDAPLPGTSDVTAYLVLGGSVIVLAGVVTFFVIRARKKKKEELEIPEDE